MGSVTIYPENSFKELCAVKSNVSNKNLQLHFYKKYKSACTATEINKILHSTQILPHPHQSNVWLNAILIQHEQKASACIFNAKKKSENTAAYKSCWIADMDGCSLEANTCKRKK